MTHQILIVGDDRHLLDDSSNILQPEFRVETACGCKEGLASVHLLGPFDLVMAHARMSGLSGVEFLDRVRELAPHTVRILLAPPRDRARARAAMNEGRVFRYLTTPCRQEIMLSAIRLGLSRFRSNVEAGESIKQAKERVSCQASPAAQEIYQAGG